MMRTAENFKRRPGTMKKNTQKQSEKVNPMCENCGKFGGECQGTMEKVWTGCIYKTPKN